MSYPRSGLCRITVHGGGVPADLSLPNSVPVATLLPSIVDVLSSLGGGRLHGASAAPYRLSRPGSAQLDGSRTLAQQGIRDGCVLTLARVAAPAPTVRFDDPAEQVAGAVRTLQQPWPVSARRLAAGTSAAGLCGVAGFIAVPGGPGAPNALLAVVAAAAVTVLSSQASGCGAPVRTAVCWLAGLAVLAASAAMMPVLIGVSLQVIGAVAAAVSVTLIQASGRIAVGVTGLARRPGPAVAQTAYRLLTGLVTVCAAAVALSAVGVAAGTPAGGVPPFAGVALLTAVGVAMVLRVRSHTDRVQTAALLAGGVTALSAALLAAGLAAPAHRSWLCATAVLLAAVAVAAGFTEAGRFPLVRRGAELLQWLALGALATLACWVCRLYTAVDVLRPG